MSTKTMIVEFGEGRVGVMRTGEQGQNFDSGIAFVHQEPHPIGEVIPGRIGKTTDEVGSFLRFHFKNSESVQVLIDDLRTVRDSIKSNTAPRPLSQREVKKPSYEQLVRAVNSLANILIEASTKGYVSTDDLDFSNDCLDRVIPLLLGAGDRNSA